jgi:glycosyltransferase involved in cell wall biosynthesis
MKVLYIGNYRDGSGWSDACINNILAMDKTGIDVVPRCVSYSMQHGNPPEKILELEKKSSYNCDICIQHVLPDSYVYDSTYKKNIGFLAVESSNFKDTAWQHHANLLDEIWVPSLYSKAACRRSGITVPIHVVPHSLDINQYLNAQFTKKIVELENTFNFLFIGEFIERKNISALIKAFHTEFDMTEPVNLMIKTSRQNIDYINNYSESIKRGLKIRTSYKKEIIICGKLNKNDYLSVIKQCHCFVMPSRAEGFCIPALEAMALGLPVIHASNTGMDDFSYGIKVMSRMTPCFGAVDTIPFLDNAHSDWSEIDIRSLMIAMRNYYMKWNTVEAKNDTHNAIEKAKLYSHQSVGTTIKDLLNDC